MAKAYSLDLREKALGLIRQYKSVDDVSSLLGIGRSTLFLWRKREAEEGSPAARPEWRKGHSHAIKDLEAFKNFVDKNVGRTAKEMSSMLNLTLQTMCKWLKRTGYVRKKRPTAIRNETKQGAQHIWIRSET